MKSMKLIVESYDENVAITGVVVMIGVSSRINQKSKLTGSFLIIKKKKSARVYIFIRNICFCRIFIERSVTVRNTFEQCFYEI